MQILPQLIYLFRTLAIAVPASFLSSLQPLINRFLWGGRRARCAFSRIVKYRSAGGVGHTHIRDYYTASILAQLKSWFPSSIPTLWALLERQQVPGGNLYNFLLSSPSFPCPPPLMGPTIHAPIAAWKSLASLASFMQTHSPETSPISPVSFYNWYFSC